MKFALDKDEKVALLQAVAFGILDTRKIPRIAKEIQGRDTFLELMKELDAQEGETDNDLERLT